MTDLEDSRGVTTEELERLRRRVAELEARDQALQFSINGIALSDLNGTLAFVNRSFLLMWGYEEAREVLGRPAASFWESGDVAERIIQTLGEKGVWVGEMTARRKDGERFPVQLSAAVVKDPTGRPSGMMGSFVDITERARAEARVRSVTRLYAFLSQINQAVVRIKDQEELFRTICRVAIEFGGFRMAWIGLVDAGAGTVRPAAHAGHDDGYLERLSVRTGSGPEGQGPTGSALREGTLVVCQDIATDPRMERWRHEALARGYRSSAAIPFRLKGQVVGALNLYASDTASFVEEERTLLTEIGIEVSFALDNMERARDRARAEAALRQSEERLSFVVSNSPAVTYACRPSGDYGATFVSSNVARHLGYEAAAFVADPGFWAAHVHPDDKPRIFAGLSTLSAKGSHAHEYRFRHRDGGWRWMHDELRLIRDAHGEPVELLGSWVDVTDRKEAEEALRRSEERYRALFETMAQGVVYQGPDGRILSANPAAERILGLTLEQMQGRSSLDPRWRAVREDGSDFAGDRHPAMESLRTGQPVSGVTMGVFHPAHGEYRWILVDAVPEFLPGESRPHRVYATFTDVTERRKAQAALQAAKEYAENLIDTANSIVVGMDAGGNVTVFNRAAEAITGYSRSELQGRNWFEVVVPKDRYPSVWAEFERLRAQGVPRNFENPIRTKGGEERYVVWQNNELHEQGEVAGTISFGVDITERRRAEEHLRRRTEGLGILLEVSRNLAATLDVTSVLQASTDGVTKLFGLDTAAVYLVEGDTLCLGAATPPLPPDLPQGLRNAPRADHSLIGKALSSGLPLLVPDALAADLTPAERAVVEQRRLRTVLFLPLIAGVKSVGILIVGSVAVPRAVSEAEIDLCLTLANLSALAIENARLYRSDRQYAVDLEQQMIERRRADQERLELERRLLHAQKLESLGILAGGIAHDFNNLLMAILANLDMALRKVSPDAPARANLERSAQAAHRATDLTRQMLAYSGKGRFVVTAIDLSALVEENAHLFRASVPRTATLDLRLDRSLLSVEADAGQVQQVIMNLITNASEAIGERSGRIVITTGVEECDATRLKRSRIDAVPPAGRFVFLEVSDTGCGMDEETQQRLFDPFFTTKAPGRGLGMSAILGIVRGHGGAIFVDSAVGEGTSMRIHFPAIERARPPKDPAAHRAAEEAEVLTPAGAVLVVDDEETVRIICKDMVEALGLPVLTAVDGRDAVELFTRHAGTISHVILDLSMPNMDGMAAFTELVRIKPGVRVILSSGYDEQELIQRMSARGLAGFIQKPYSLDALRDALERAGACGAAR